jgi:circadian clock protein KaiC
MTTSAAADRVTTGTAAGDAVLGGGFPANTINIVMGQPGTGKTIFVEQILFANAGQDRPVLYLTTLSEPMAKVVRFVQAFEFYDETRLGTSVLYDDVGTELAEEGIAALLPRLKSAIKELKPAVIVVDSFRALHDLATSVVEVRRMVHELTGLLTAYDTTAFLIGEYHQEDIRRYPEFAVADGVVELSRRELGTRDERFFRVLKLRGSRYREGYHAFQITDRGLRIHPRLVSPRLPMDYRLEVGRVSTGVPGLDSLLEGGLPAGTATLVTGPSGSGKTTLALQFLLDGVRGGEPSLYLNFQENPTQIGRTIRRLAGDDATAAALDVFYTSPVELQIDSIVGELFGRIEEHGIGRLAVDGIGDLVTSTTEPHRVHDYLYALTQHLAVRGITSVLTLEDVARYGDPSPSAVPGPISYLADNLIALGMDGGDTMRRTLRVLKARNSAHDTAVREIQIGPDGIRIE